jgi:spermidine/putrescine transport system permease protein
MASTTVASQRPPIRIDAGKVRRDMVTRRVGKLFTLTLAPMVGYFFLWAPIVLLVVFSFNDSRSLARWEGFTLQWYANIVNNVVGGDATFSTGKMLEAFQNSLVVGLIATTASTIIGTMVALSLVRGNFPGKRFLDGLLFLPIVIPEITQGLSLLVFFNAIFGFVNDATGWGVQRGLGTIILGHIVFSISFVAIVVRARLADMNPRLEEAAQDLGANEWRTFWRVTFPLILPGIIAGALLAFTLSLDDYVVTIFMKGVGGDTLPVFVFGLLKLTVTPEINAISTIILVMSTVLVSVSLYFQGRGGGRVGV